MDISQHVQFPKTLFISVVSLVVFIAGCKRDSQTLSESQKQELISTIEQFNNAFAQSDLATLELLVTPNYQHTNSTSQAIDKESWFEYLTKRDKAIRSGDLIVNTYSLNELNIEYHGNSAIATGKVSTSFTKDDKTVENEYRVTNVWVYQKGKWKRAGFHDGKIK